MSNNKNIHRITEAVITIFLLHGRLGTGVMSMRLQKQVCYGWINGNLIY